MEMEKGRDDGDGGREDEMEEGNTKIDEDRMELRMRG